MSPSPSARRRPPPRPPILRDALIALAAAEACLRRHGSNWRNPDGWTRKALLDCANAALRVLIRAGSR